MKSEELATVVEGAVLKKTLSLVLMGAALVLPSQAQLLRLTIKDKAMQENVMFANHGDFPTVTFDENGQWTYDSDKLTKGADVSIFVPQSQFGFIPVYIEPGKTACVEIVLKKGKPQAKFTGDNVDVSQFLQQYWAFEPERQEVDLSRYEDIEDDEQREEALSRAKAAMTDTISFEEAFKRLDRRYADVLKAAKAIKNPSLNEKYQKETQLRYLTNRLRMTQHRDRVRHIDLKQDDSYQQLLAQIDPNDIDGADQMFRLPQTFIESKLTTSSRDVNQTDYALDNINNIAQYISNENVRHRLLSDLGMMVFNSSYTGQVFEMDKFWPAFKKVAPQRTLDYFLPIYDSRVATQAGKPCPDVSFSDLQGQKHRLSDYFGKYIYIDIWATWCGPCCAEIPYIEKHVAHYKDNPRIQFVSISIDHDHGAWVRKLEKDKPEWLQFICDKEEYKTISQQWGVTGIPRFIIINPDGTINNAEAFRPSASDFRERIDALLEN